VRATGGLADWLGYTASAAMRSGPLRPLLVLALALEITGLGLAPVGALAAGRVPRRLGLPPAPPAPFVVAIDPGHGGSYDPQQPHRPWDPGAISPFNGLVERVVTLDEGIDLRRLLEATGVQVVMTRTTNVFVSIPNAEAVVDRSHANLFVSLWVNDWYTPQVEGVTVFTPRRGDTAFAERIDAGLAAAARPYGMVNRGVQPRTNLWVHAPMPTVTIEAGFMSNRKDSLLLAQPAVRLALARGVFAGLVAYAPVIRRLHAQQTAYRRALGAYDAAERSLARARRRAQARVQAARQRQALDPLLWLAALLLVMGVYRRFLARQVGQLGRVGTAARAAASTRLAARAPRPAADGPTPPRRARRRRAHPPGRRVPALRPRAGPARPATGTAWGSAVALGGRSTGPRRRVADLVQPAEPVRHRRTVYDELWP